jgi:glycosyltransferase involved in cell wall biosynthesis
MKILHLTTYSGGGAAISARRLSDGLNQLGVESRLFTLDDLPAAGLWGKIRRTLRYRRDGEKFDGYTLTPQTEIFTHPYSLYNLIPHVGQADVVHLHWVSRFVDFPTFFRRLNRPMVWTLHDMNAFTGGCHYSEGCEGFQNACVSCPQLPDKKIAEAERNFDVKRRAYAALPASTPVVTPSAWLHRLAKSSLLLGRFVHRHIPNGLDLDKEFFPEDKTAARKKLGLDDLPTVLFVADRLDSRWKGFAYLQLALYEVRKKVENAQVVAVGGGAQSDDNTRFLGRCEGEKLRRAYNAADVFVIPSVEDNLPNTPIEAAACATPAVGFRAGGVPEIIDDGVTGYVVPKRDVPAMAEAIVSLLLDPEKARAMGAAARNRALEMFPLRRQAQAYLEIYRELVAHPGKATYAMS